MNAALQDLFDGVFDDIPQTPEPKQRHVTYDQAPRNILAFEGKRFSSREEAKKLLHQHYKEAGSIRALAARYEVSKMTVYCAMRRLNIPRKPPGGRNNLEGRRSRKLYKVNNQTGTISSLARANGNTYNTVANRLARGWTITDAFTIPKQPQNGRRCVLRHN